MTISLYSVLGVRRNSSAAVIKKAFRKLAAAAHPDRNPGDASAEKRYKELVRAYEVLSSPERRKCYDETGQTEREKDGVRIEAVNLVIQSFDKAVHDRLSTGREPAKCDLLAEMKVFLNSKAEKCRQALGKMRETRSKVMVLSGRFHAEENFLDELVASRLADIDKSIAQVEHNAAVTARALNILGEYSFDRIIEANNNGVATSLSWPTGNLLWTVGGMRKI